MKRVGIVAAILLLSISVFAQQTDKAANASLVEDFRNSPYFFRQIEIGKNIVALNDRSLLEKLTDLLSSEDRHIRGNAAFVFAGLGDIRGFDIINGIIQDTSYRVKGQGVALAPGDGKYHVEAQIDADRYYAVHLLGELHDARAIPILTPLLKDPTIDYKVTWALGQIPDKSGVPPLLEALRSRNPDVRVIAIQSLEQLHATEALPQLRVLLEDNERSHFDTLMSVAEAASKAIAALERKP
jgi:HEAT repeat protein